MRNKFYYVISDRCMRKIPNIFFTVCILLFYAFLYMRIERANLTRFSEVFYEGRIRVFWEQTNFFPFSLFVFLLNWNFFSHFVYMYLT